MHLFIRVELKGPKTALTNCTCESKSSCAARNPGSKQLGSPLLPQQGRRSAQRWEGPEKVGGQGQGQLPSLSPQVPPPKLERPSVSLSRNRLDPPVCALYGKPISTLREGSRGVSGQRRMASAAQPELPFLGSALSFSAKKKKPKLGSLD